MRLLPAGHPDLGEGVARPQPGAVAARDRRGARRQYLPLRQPSPHPARGRARRRADARGSRADERRTPSSAGAARSTIRGSTNGCGFPTPGRVTVSTGRVEIGQGVLTAMLQIAADELDVSPDRIDAADRRHRPDPERGLHRRQPVDPVRRRRAAPRLRRGARPVSRPRRRDAWAAPAAISRCSDGAILRGGEPTGQDYWSLAGAVDLAPPRHRRGAASSRRPSTASSARTRRASISPPRCSARRSSSTT